MLKVLLAVFLAGVVGTMLGGVLGIALKKKNISVGLLYGFAGGVMTAMVLSDLVVEAIKKSNVVFALLLMIAGYLVVQIVDIAVNKKEKRTEILKTFAVNNDKLTAMIVITSIAVHNFPEGMIIGASSVASLSIGYVIMIALHNIPEGMAIALPMALGKAKPTKILFTCFLSGLPTVIGGVISYYLGGVSEAFIAGSIAFSSGAMLYVAINELFRECYANKKHDVYGISVGILTGLLIIFCI